MSNALTQARVEAPTTGNADEVTNKRRSPHVIDVNRSLGAIPQEDKASFVERFNNLDTDASGSITVEEIHRWRRSLRIPSDSLIELEDWVTLVDTEGDGEIQRDEFVVFMYIAQREGDLSGLTYVRGKEPKKEYTFWESTWRQAVWKTLEDPSSSTLAGAISFVMILLIFFSVMAYCVETVHKVQESSEAMEVLAAIEVVSVVAFSGEYILRLLCTPNPRRFIFGFLNIVDLVAVLPFYLNLALSGENESGALRVARLTRVARIFKLSRYLGWLRLYYNALNKAKIPLAMALFVTMVDTIIFASLAFFAERGKFNPVTERYEDEDGAPSVFQSVFDGLFWCFITITTVGYGEVVPNTGIGQVVGVLSMVSGILILAIPISIFSTHFQAEYVELKKQQQRTLQRQREKAAPETLMMTDKAGSDTTQFVDAQAKARHERAPSKLGFAKRLSVALHKVLSRAGGSKSASSGSKHGAKVVPRPEATSVTESLEKLTPKVALIYGLEALDSAGVTSLEQRNLLRKRILHQQTQRVIDQKREKLWLEFRVLERKFREDVMTSTIDRYSTWFIKSDEDLENEILAAVLRIQSAFRGGMARLMFSSKLVSWSHRAKSEASKPQRVKLPGEAIQENDTEDAEGDGDH